MDLEKKPVVSNVGAWAMNVISSVGIIMVNKQLMSPGGYGFSFGTLALSFSVDLSLVLVLRIGNRTLGVRFDLLFGEKNWR